MRRVHSSEQRGPGRPAVPLDRIVVAALDIVDNEGTDALSMRTLAQRLSSGTATLYRHFSSRAALIAAVVDNVLGEALDQLDLDGLRWEEASRRLAHAVFSTLKRHRNVAPLLIHQVPLGPNAMALRERGISILLQQGLTPSLAARCHAVLARYVLGFATQSDGQPGQTEEMAAKFRSADPVRFPASAAVAGSRPTPLDDEFAFGLELVLSGLAQLLRRERRARAK